MIDPRQPSSFIQVWDQQCERARIGGGFPVKRSYLKTLVSTEKTKAEVGVVTKSFYNGCTYTFTLLLTVSVEAVVL